MKIRELAIKNTAHRWELEKTTFPGLTLLVGASGVGKTQILNSFRKLIHISNGDAYNGLQWNFRFTVGSGGNYTWTGEFENLKDLEQQAFKKKEIPGNGTPKPIPRLLDEKLFLEDRLVFQRRESDILYEGKTVPKSSPYTSVLNLFTSEEKIAPVKEAFRKIIFLDHHLEQAGEVKEKDLQSLSAALPQAASPEERFAVFADWNAPVMIKLALAYQVFKPAFDDIADDFKHVFPQVEDVQFKLLEKHNAYELRIKERGTDWVSMKDISSGMFKTLLNIAQMTLTAEGYVILIDEFENSLGANCIDVVAENISSPGKDVQYIITSHHPYVINNIDIDKWKIVVREGPKVFTKNAQQLKLGKSKHEAFKQLLNLDAFTEGIS